MIHMDIHIDTFQHILKWPKISVIRHRACREVECMIVPHRPVAWILVLDMDTEVHFFEICQLLVRSLGDWSWILVFENC